MYNHVYIYIDNIYNIIHIIHIMYIIKCVNLIYYRYIVARCLSIFFPKVSIVCAMVKTWNMFFPIKGMVIPASIGLAYPL
jgi:hypothetical protein